MQETTRRRGRPENLTNMGKGRKKGVPNRVTPAMKKLALFLVDNAAMEKAELIARLSKIGRSDVGAHLKITDGVAEPYIDPAYTDILRELTVKRTADKDGVSVETKLKVADPRPALADLAEIYGLKKEPPRAVDMNVLIQMLQVNVAPERLHEAALEALSQED